VSDLWLDALEVNPLPTLLAWEDAALPYFVRRDLLDEPTGPVAALWEAAGARRLLQKQQPDGSWRYPGKSYDPETGTHYDLLETYRSLRVLVEMYGVCRDHPALQQAAEYVFAQQTDEGDIRGIIGSQYMPYYHGAILELLIKAGYADDPRIEGRDGIVQPQPHFWRPLKEKRQVGRQLTSEAHRMGDKVEHPVVHCRTSGAPRPSWNSRRAFRM
jgi:hypothetical protein